MIDIENINFDIVSREEMRDWIQYGILHYGLDDDITDALFEEFDISEEKDDDEYQFAYRIYSRTAEIYFKLGFEVAKKL